MSAPDPARFYDDLAEHYDLVFEDWEASMARQGEAIARMLDGLGSPKPRERFRVLDAAAGIGTQALSLAALGYDVTARDLSGRAVERLRREAARRGVAVDAGRADMREIGASVEGPFDAVIAFDNALPHLESDAEIRTALEGFRELLAPGGGVLVSVRDYDGVDRSPTSSHPYGERTRDGRRFRLRQEWTWLDPRRYRTTFVVEERGGEGWHETVRTDAVCYAVPVGRLLELMEEAGLASCRVGDVPFYQPVLVGSA